MRIRTLCIVAVLTLCAAMTAGASGFHASRSISLAMIAILALIVLALIVLATGVVSAAPHRQTAPPSLETVTVEGTSPGLTCGADLDRATAASVHSATVGRATGAAASTVGISGTTLAYIHPEYHNTWRPS